MRKRLTLLLFVVFLFLVPAAQAQGMLSLATLEVALWPEYDRPEVLVIYKAKLPADISLPVDVSLKIPAIAGEPFAVRINGAGSCMRAGCLRSMEQKGWWAERGSRWLVEPFCEPLTPGKVWRISKGITNNAHDHDCSDLLRRHT